MSSSAFHRARDRRVKWKGGKDPEVRRIHRGLYIHPFSQPNCLPSNPQGKSTDIPLLSPFVVHHTHSFISTYHLIESICEIYLIIYAKKDANANNSWVDCRQTIYSSLDHSRSRAIAICEWRKKKGRDCRTNRVTNLIWIWFPLHNLFEPYLGRSSSEEDILYAEEGHSRPPCPSSSGT